MDITFVRHGQPRWTVDGIAQSDPPLTELGARQARLVAERLAEEAGDADLVVSPAVRALETAAPVAAALGVEPEIVADLTEIRLPDVSGQPEEVVLDFFRGLYRREPADWWDGAPGGESFGDFHRRVAAGLTGVLAARGVLPIDDDPAQHLWDIAEPTRTVVVVAHAGVNAVALGLLLGLDPTPWEWERFVLRHASIARLKTMRIGSAHVFSMHSFNDVEHLRPDQRTR